MTVDFLERNAKGRLAYVYTPPVDLALPTILFCGGYRSDMQGTKALFLEQQCRARGQGYVRFDYSGHGQSDGMFEDLTITDWLADAMDILEFVVAAPVLLVGSSMGGWIVLLMALRMQGLEDLRGLIGLAAAPDFTEEMFFDRLDDAQRRDLMEKGVVYVPNAYSNEPYAFTRAFYEDGKRNLVLDRPCRLPCPARFVQGKRDFDVRWETVLKIQSAFGLSPDALILVEDGDHRLSAPHHLDVIWKAILQCY